MLQTSICKLVIISYFISTSHLDKYLVEWYSEQKYINENNIIIQTFAYN